MDKNKYKILLAEDGHQNMRLLFEASNTCIYRVFVASNWKRAVEPALRYHPDSIIINWDNPEIDPMEAIERIRFEMEVMQHKPDKVTHEMEINALSLFVSKLRMIDINSIDELLFLSVIIEIVYMHFIRFNFKSRYPYLVERAKVDSVCYSKSNQPDDVNIDIVTNTLEIFSDQNACKLILPHQINK